MSETLPSSSDLATLDRLTAEEITARRVYKRKDVEGLPFVVTLPGCEPYGRGRHATIPGSNHPPRPALPGTSS